MLKFFQTNLHNQKFRQRQKVVITPKLKQALDVLLMPKVELTRHMIQEQEQNPFLEIDEEEETPLPDEEFDPDPEWNQPEENIDREDTATDIDWDTAFEDRVSLSERINSNSSPPDEYLSEIAQERSLNEDLAEQLQLATFTETERAIGELILGNLNGKGQLQLKLFQIPGQFATELDNGSLSEELHTLIEKNLRNATDDRELEFSKTSTIQVRMTGSHNQTGGELCSHTRGWKIIDRDNSKTYTVLPEQPPNHCTQAEVVSAPLCGVDTIAQLNFYQLTLEDIAEEVGCDIRQVKAVLRTIQDTFEPQGIAYRDIREKWLIRIRIRRQHKETVHPLVQEIVEKHFDDVENRRFNRIAEALGVNTTEIHEAIETLSPYPGISFTDSAARALGNKSAPDILPEVEVRYVNGECHIISTDDDQPRLKLNTYYLNLMKNLPAALNAEDKEWMEERYRDAKDYLSCIAERSRTIFLITKAIFDVQVDFFAQGEKGIKPLTLKTVADRVGVHESTVSRVTSNKYVKTPHGTILLKFFFSNKVETTQGDTVSAKQVKVRIAEMIRDEDHDKPLSDQAISDQLKAKGVSLARRTVQKYRKELAIPPSRERASEQAT